MRTGQSLLALKSSAVSSCIQATCVDNRSIDIAATDLVPDRCSFPRQKQWQKTAKRTSTRRNSPVIATYPMATCCQSRLTMSIPMARTIRVLTHTKNRERRTLTLVPPVVIQLKKIQKVRRIGTDLIFTHPATGKANPFYFDKAWREARDKAKLKDFRFHDLRHSCASNLAMIMAIGASIS